jgi:magnesium chelatase family protein
MDRENIEAVDWAVMRGRYLAKRILEVAASGNHSTLLVGSSHTGKTTMARSLTTILPGKPFIAPSPTFPDALSDALEQARDGIVFLRRLEQWGDSSLALLRERVVQQQSQFLLIATTGYCPCGNYSDETKSCICSEEAKDAYQGRLSKTIDTCFALEAYIPSVNSLASVHPDEASHVVRKRVDAARLIQYQRGEAKLNSALSLAEIEQWGSLDAPAEELLAAAHQQLALSPEQSRFLRQVARTCADLASDDVAVAWVSARHLAEALQYRPRWPRPSL